MTPRAATCLAFALIHPLLAHAVKLQEPENVEPDVKVLQPGIKITMLVEHPDIVTPTGIDVDDSGQIWAVACHTHFRPEDYPGPELDEVLIFDPDGSNRRVFYSKTEATMDLELGPDGWVYLAERDRILRIKDTDGDGKADVEENIAVLETVADYPHNGLAGIAWHPSGDLVFSLGENFWKVWTLTGTDSSEVIGTGEGGIFRCGADGTNLRRIAKGFWNPFGVCVRDDGEIFTSENDPGARPPCRMIHVVEGGDYGYQRLYGNAPVHPFVAWNGELRGTLPMMHPSGEAPCGVLPLGGGLIAGTWSDNRVDFYPLRRKGASFETKRIPLVTGSDHFRPTCIAQGPDGAFYFTDWVFTAYDLHLRGRIWKLEIDLDAPWMTPNVTQPPNQDAELAKRLRQGAPDVEFGKLLEQIGEDPFLTRAALEEMARREEIFAKKLSNWEAQERPWITFAQKLAKPKDEALARTALRDEDVQTQFEALRWIADENLTGLKTEVDSKIRDSELPYWLFEACLATANTLAGKPRNGITDIPMLLDRVRDNSASEKSRAYALRLIPPRDRRLKFDLLKRLVKLDAAQQTASPLTIEAVRTLAFRGDKESRTYLAEIMPEAHVPNDLQKDAILGFAAAPAEHKDVLLGFASDFGQRPYAKGLPYRHLTAADALRALRGGVEFDDEELRQLRALAEDNPELADSVQALADPAFLLKDQPALTDTAAWLERIETAPGKPNVYEGQRIFHHPRLTRCATCHRHSGRGNVVGPDLTNVTTQGNRAWLLRAILEPNHEVAPQFHPRVLNLADGSSFTGFLLRKGGRSGKEFYRDITGSEVAYLKTDIVGRDEIHFSLMPPGLVSNLTARELRDLIHFLEVGFSD